MDNCDNKLVGQFTRFGSNDTTNCQLKIDKETFNRYKDTLTQKQIYANLANRRVNNLSVCNLEKTIITSDNSQSLVRPEIDTTNQRNRDISYDKNTDFDNSNLYNKSELASDLIEDLFLDTTGISQVVLANDSYPSCSYKAIKF
ncbi:MAG: hypothetical protein CMD14_09495 [Flavobacteriales bacterium]|nr:hypothetical protein [Flavobacteriales bacterium]|tara:strand:- start:14260 stop:14691 length:432 start_codon:yes stop_codon:yes gene_type:complete